MFRNRHKFAKNSESPEKGERTSQCGGRGGIPPQTPPAASPASLLEILAISDTKAKGARGEKTRARSRRSRILIGFCYFFIADADHDHHCDSKRPTSASTAHVTRHSAHPHGRSASVELCFVEQSSTGVANAMPVCARRGEWLMEEAEVDRFSKKYYLFTVYGLKYFLTSLKNGKMYS